MQVNLRASHFIVKLHFKNDPIPVSNGTTQLRGTKQTGHAGTRPQYYHIAQYPQPGS